MAEITLRLSKREADALAQDWGRWRKSSARRSAEFKMREAVWATFPDLREADYYRAERKAHEENLRRDLKALMGLR